MLRVVVALRGHARMLAVAQRTSWVLVLQALGWSVGDAISVGGRRRKCSARDYGTDGAFEASETPSSRLAMRDHAQLLASAGRTEQRRCWRASGLQRERCCIGAQLAQE